MSRAERLIQQLGEADFDADIQNLGQPVITPPSADPDQPIAEVEINWSDYDGEPEEDEQGTWRFRIGDSLVNFSGPYAEAEWGAVEQAMEMGETTAYLVDKA